MCPQKTLGELWTGIWVPHNTRDQTWISSSATRRSPRSGAGGSSRGSTSRSASSMTGRNKPSKKNAGFAQPLAGHQHWQIDVSYLNIGGTFYLLCSILDGSSSYI